MVGRTWHTVRSRTEQSTGRSHSAHQALQDHYVRCRLQGLKTVTWQLFYQRASSFEGRSPKHTRGFDFLFLKPVNWIKQTSCFGITQVTGREDALAVLHCPPPHQQTQQQKGVMGYCIQAPELDGDGTRLVSGCLRQFADEQTEGCVGSPGFHSWLERECIQAVIRLSTTVPSEHPARGLCPHRESYGGSRP